MEYDKLVKFLLTDCQVVAEQMLKSDHQYDNTKEGLNPYHLEGSVFTHTLMVLQQAEFRNMPEPIKYASLFHDFGKPECRTVNDEKKYVMFRGHGGYSAFKSIYYMKKLGLTEYLIIRLFKLISLHTDLYGQDTSAQKVIDKYKYDDELVKDIYKLGVCDGMGRFTDEEVSPREQGCIELKAVIDNILKEVYYGY